MKRITWLEAVAHGACSATWDTTGLRLLALFLIDPTWFSGATVLAVAKRGREAVALTFDPRVGLWVTSWVICTHIAGAMGYEVPCMHALRDLQWFREQWCERRDHGWKWDGSGRRLRAAAWFSRRTHRAARAHVASLSVDGRPDYRPVPDTVPERSGAPRDRT